MNSDLVARSLFEFALLQCFRVAYNQFMLQKELHHEVLWLNQVHDYFPSDISESANAVKAYRLQQEDNSRVNRYPVPLSPGISDTMGKNVYRPQEVYARYAEEPPRTFDEALSQQHHDDGLVVMIGKTLYHGATHTEATAATIRCLVAACPPFRAFVYAAAMSWFDLAVRTAFWVKSSRLVATICLCLGTSLITACS